MSVAVVKLGSSIVAEDSGELRTAVVSRLCAEFAALHHEGWDVVVVTSGAIARGIHALGLPARPSAIEELQAASAVGMGGLYRVYESELAAAGVRAAQVLLTFADMRTRANYLNARRTMAKLLEWRVVPVVNENDTTTTDEISFGDNDFLAAQVAVLVAADVLVLLTDIGGLFTANPRVDPQAELVTEVRDFEELGTLAIGHETSALGSGGMRSKVVAAEMATAAGIRTVICSGLDDRAVERAVRGEPEGTMFPPQADRQPSFKLWLKYAKPAHGRLVVDDGAVRALREGGTSLLPVGILRVEGHFDAGDAVIVVGPDGAVVGKGICGFDAVELERVRGRRGAQVRELLGTASEEAVHRDYFVLS